MRAFRKPGMRPALTAALAAAAIALAAKPLPAAAADVTIPLNATPVPQLVQGYAPQGYVYQAYDFGGRYYDYDRPACPEHYYYTCKYGPYGTPQCTCWPGFGFFGYH
jgi:hypothetical protein